MDNLREQLKPGRRVRVTGRLPPSAGAGEPASFTVVGEVVAFGPQPTGSWFAFGQLGRLWLDRLTIRKSDGELSELVLDETTVIELTDEVSPAGFPPPGPDG